jgi:hypothetical protein
VRKKLKNQWKDCEMDGGKFTVRVDNTHILPKKIQTPDILFLSYF